MNLTKLFEMQSGLDKHIMDQHPELKGQNNLDWKLLALQVELGECANEWRGFKKWSKNQEPRNKDIECHACKGLGEFHRQILHGVEHVEDKTETCTYCDGTGIQERNPLLMEYVDCLHFLLSIGLEEITYISINAVTLPLNLDLSNDIIEVRYQDISTQFLYLFNSIGYLTDSIIENEMTLTSDAFGYYVETWRVFIGLGQMLGFTWEQVEQAYFEKNQINHERQNAGY